MRTFTETELKEILKKHKMWLNNEDGGEKADLRGTDLRGTDLSYAILIDADLRGTNLIDANLSGANLRCTNLRRTDLRGTDLRGTDLSYAILIDADLRGTDLRGTDLRGTDLRGTDLRGVNSTNINYNHLTSFFALQCPEFGSFICFKKVQNYIIKMQVTENAKRSSATSRKCRASEVLVLEIQNLDGTKADVDEVVNKSYDHDTVYKVGELTIPNSFDDDRWNECSNGIHFFITREEAVQYD